MDLGNLLECFWVAVRQISFLLIIFIFAIMHVLDLLAVSQFSFDDIIIDIIAGGVVGGVALLR